MTEEPQEERRADDCPTAENAAESDPADAPDANALLEEAERERERFRALALRCGADLENYKKRAAQELADARERANERLLLKAVDFADNFGRALEHPPQDAADVDNWLEGVRIAMRGMESMLASEGVLRIEVAVGGEFDADVHEALFMQPTDEVPEGSVAAVISSGYRLHSRVLRAAQVSVAAPAVPRQNQANPAESEHDSATQQETN